MPRSHKGHAVQVHRSPQPPETHLDYPSGDPFFAQRGPRWSTFRSELTRREAQYIFRELKRSGFAVRLLAPAHTPPYRPTVVAQADGRDWDEHRPGDRPKRTSRPGGTTWWNKTW